MSESCIRHHKAHKNESLRAAIRLSILLAIAFPAVVSRAQVHPPALTTEWLAGAGSRVGDVPSYLWLSDGTAILDTNTFEKLDPVTGKQHPVLDMQRAVSSLKSIAPEVDVHGKLPWPVAFNHMGKQAVYLFGGDLFLLDLDSSAFSRLTQTPQEEKDPQFSPNGRFVAFVRDNNLYLLDVPAKKESQLTHDGSQTTLNGTLSWVYWEEVFGRHDTAYWWSPDSASIAYLQTDEAGVPISTFVDFVPVDPRLIHQTYPKPGEHNPVVRVGVIDVNSGSNRFIPVTGKPYEWLLRVNWLPDSQHLSLKTLDRSQRELGLYLSDLQGREVRRVLTETDPVWVNVNDDLYFLRDGHFIWASERDGYMHLYRYAADGTLVNQVTKGNWSLVSSGGGVFWVRQGVVGIDERSDWIYFTALKDGSVERQLYRIHSDGSSMQRISTEPGTHSIGMSPDAQYYFDAYSNIRTLPTLRLHAAGGALKATIAAPRTALLPTGLEYPRLMTIPAADGFPMPAQILKPAGFDPARRYPVILHVYGGPSAPTVIDQWQNETLFDNLLASKGYITVAIDNRVATGISKTLENTLAASPGEGETADLLAGIRWLKAQPWVDGSRVGVWGWSGGGTITLNLMTRSREFKAGIAGAPVTDWRFYDSKWGESFLKLPQNNPAGYDKASLIPRARDLHGSLLLIYGTYDDNVHPQNEEAFMNALIAAGKPYRVVLFPMRKHGFVDTPALIERYNAMLAFWEQDL
jgi:dipeptidyl-peptidase 4